MGFEKNRVYATLPLPCGRKKVEKVVSNKPVSVFIEMLVFEMN